jgi:hypothetical protein
LHNFLIFILVKPNISGQNLLQPWNNSGDITVYFSSLFEFTSCTIPAEPPWNKFPGSKSKSDKSDWVNILSKSALTI